VQDQPRGGTRRRLGPLRRAPRARLRLRVRPDPPPRHAGGGEGRMIDAVSTWIAASQRIVVLTGAGISTDSGIPDFRGPQGVWTKDPQAEKQATLQHYVADPEVRRRAWRARPESPGWEAKPNDGHKALVTLERRGRPGPLLTQNVGGLPPPAGSAPQKVLEIPCPLGHAAR